MCVRATGTARFSFWLLLLFRCHSQDGGRAPGARAAGGQLEERAHRDAVPRAGGPHLPRLVRRRQALRARGGQVAAGQRAEEGRVQVPRAEPRRVGRRPRQEPRARELRAVAGQRDDRGRRAVLHAGAGRGGLVHAVGARDGRRRWGWWYRRL